jgi:hypothetical protein
MGIAVSHVEFRVLHILCAAANLLAPTPASTGRYAVFQTHLIERHRYVYLASERLSWRLIEKTIVSIVSGPVRSAIANESSTCSMQGRDHNRVCDQSLR